MTTQRHTLRDAPYALRDDQGDRIKDHLPGGEGMGASQFCQLALIP